MTYPGYLRDETEAHQLDRNYGELLQEVRVAQAGVQILFAFLLTIAFQQRFATLNSFQRDLYVVTLVASAISVICFVAPVAAHRVLFRRKVKDHLVIFTGRLASVGLMFLGLSVLGGVLLVTDLVLNLVVAFIIVGALLLLAVILWLLWPRSLRNRKGSAADR